VDRQRFETFERDSREVARARQVVRETLRAWHLDADLGDFELLVSELVSNAVRHGSGQIQLHLCSEGPNLRVEVVDGGGRRPPPPAGEPQAGGIGLQLVDQLTDSWGLHRDDHRTMAWLVKRTSARQANGSNGHLR
jgi:anti-sigma regulatory factor (Ser/Thr protein kinase)